MKQLEKRIEAQMAYYRKRGLTVEQLADKHYINKNKFVEAVMEGGDTEEFYIKKEATRRLLLEKGFGYDSTNGK